MLPAKSMPTALHVDAMTASVRRPAHAISTAPVWTESSVVWMASVFPNATAICSAAIPEKSATTAAALSAASVRRIVSAVWVEVVPREAVRLFARKIANAEATPAAIRANVPQAAPITLNAVPTAFAGAEAASRLLLTIRLFPLPTNRIPTTKLRITTTKHLTPVPARTPTFPTTPERLVPPSPLLIARMRPNAPTIHNVLPMNAAKTASA